MISSIFTNYVEWLLPTVCEFLMAEPVIYISVGIIFLFIVKVIKSLMRG